METTLEKVLQLIDAKIAERDGLIAPLQAQIETHQQVKIALQSLKASVVALQPQA
jgi:hypothetical protein